MSTRPSATEIAVLIMAAGRGTRAGNGTAKQYRLLAGEPVIRRTLRAFLAERRIDLVGVVIAEGDAPAFHKALSGLADSRLLASIVGGATRQASVRAGLEALAPHVPKIVLVHDAARPFVDPALIDRAITAAETHIAAVPAVAVTDTIVTRALSSDGDNLGNALDRSALRAVQTPQAFAFAPFIEAHRQSDAVGRSDFTDDGGLMLAAGHPVHLFEGDPANIKLTTQADFTQAEAKLHPTGFLTRVATGYDVHAFEAGDHVWLGGVKIPHERALAGHSDADVVLHALTDALLGTMGEADIGTHFPPSDPQWKGASSDRFLIHAVQLLRARGGILDHLDATIVCEAPKIGPYRDAIRERIAAIAGVGIDGVSIKATTSEKLGFTGRKEGIAALATVTVRLPQA